MVLGICLVGFITLQAQDSSRTSYEVVSLESIDGKTVGKQEKRPSYEQETLFGKGIAVGGYLGMTGKGTSLNGSAALLSGGEVAVVVGHKLNIGLAAYGLVTNVFSNYMDDESNRYFIDMGYGGLFLEPVFFSERLVHLSVPVTIGMGGAAINSSRIYDYDDSYEYGLVSSDAFLVLEPGINVELNVCKIVRLGAGLSYRYVSDVQLIDHSNEDFSGLSGSVNLKIGWF